MSRELQQNNWIDACIFIAKYGEERYTDICSKLINDCGIGFNGTVSTLCLGEIEQGLIEQTKDLSRFTTILADLSRRLQKFRIVPITRETIEIYNKFSHTTTRLQPHDILHLASSMSNNCSGFITFDQEILEEKQSIEQFSKDNKNKINVLNINEFKKYY